MLPSSSPSVFLDCVDCVAISLPRVLRFFGQRLVARRSRLWGIRNFSPQDFCGKTTTMQAVTEQPIKKFKTFRSPPESFLATNRCMAKELEKSGFTKLTEWQFTQFLAARWKEQTRIRNSIHPHKPSQVFFSNNLGQFK